MTDSAKLETSDTILKKNSKLRVCKACEKEIGKSVKVCPHCGTKQKRSSKLGLFLLCIGLIWAIAEGVNGAKKTESSRTIAVGESIQSGEYEISVVSADVRNSFRSSLLQSRPAQGASYLAVRARIKNISQEPIGAFSRPSLKLIDANGSEYSPDVSASGSFGEEIRTDTKILSQLNPGVSTDLIGVFEVSNEMISKPGTKLIINADDLIYVLPKNGEWNRKVNFQSNSLAF